MKQNEAVKQSTLAALMLAALATGGTAHAAESGTADFSADIEAHSAVKCEVTVSVDDPLVSAATYTKGTDGKTGTLTLTKTGNSVMTVMVKGDASCTLDGYVMEPDDREVFGNNSAFAKTKNGLAWPVDFVYTAIIQPTKRDGTTAEVHPRALKPGGGWYDESEIWTQWGWHRHTGEEYKNTNTSGHAVWTGNAIPYIASGDTSRYYNDIANTFTRPRGDAHTPSVYRFDTNATSLGVTISSIIAKYPYDPKTLEPDDTKLEDGEEVTFSRTMTLTAP